MKNSTNALEHPGQREIFIYLDDEKLKQAVRIILDEKEKEKLKMKQDKDAVILEETLRDGFVNRVALEYIGLLNFKPNDQVEMNDFFQKELFPAVESILKEMKVKYKFNSGKNVEQPEPLEHPEKNNKPEKSDDSPRDWYRKWDETNEGRNTRQSL